MICAESAQLLAELGILRAANLALEHIAEREAGHLLEQLLGRVSIRTA